MTGNATQGFYPEPKAPNPESIGLGQADISMITTGLKAVQVCSREPLTHQAAEKLITLLKEYDQFYKTGY